MSALQLEVQAAALVPQLPHGCTEDAEPLEGSLAALARQLWLCGISSISLEAVTVVPSAGGLQGLSRRELSRGGADSILTDSSTARGRSWIKRGV